MFVKSYNNTTTHSHCTYHKSYYMVLRVRSLS